MTLFDSLSKIAIQIQSQRRLMKTEEATKMVSIRPFIRALGYDIFNLAEVEPEFTADAHSSGTERVDYVIKRDGKPIILIEAKSADINLNKNHWKQLHNYFVALDAEFGVLTNGIEYRFYTDHNKRNVMDEEPFLVIDMQKLDTTQLNILDGFSKARFAPQETLRKIKISNLLEKELNQPSDEFVKHFAKHVHSGPLFQSKIQAYRPLVKRAWDDLVDQEIARRLRRHEQLEEDEPVPQAEPYTSTVSKPAAPLSDVVEVPIFAYHKGQRLEATLLVDEVMNYHKRVVYIVFEGERMSCAAATLKALRTVNPNRKTGKSAWLFWHFRHPVSDEEMPIKIIFDDVQNGGPLRQQLLDIANK